jgi:hypothetical protein
MKLSYYTSVGLGLLSLLVLANPALAQSKLQASSELSGIQNVLGVIRNVNLMQTDQSSSQFILDIMDTKNDVDGMKNVLSGTKASVLTHGRTSQQRAILPMPPVRRLKTF